LDAIEWSIRAVELGAGELLVTSMDRDGTRSGFDTELLAAIATRVRVPVIASGGAAGPDDFVTAVRDGNADAVLAASIFHRRMFSVADVKAAMAAAGLPVRRIQEAVA
jgi:cyclase